MMKLSIGAVVFARLRRHDEKHPGQLRYVPLMGEERKQALRAFYRKENLPDELVAVALNPQRRITWHDVNWSTSGIPNE